jgi:antibiotic biosynthesis monooxygenase (ABM) superfamily enzyme
MKFEGHRGAALLPPTSDKPGYTLIFTFDSEEHLKIWDDSEVKKVWLEKIKAITEKDPKVQRYTGLEFWFMPAGVGTTPPKSWKMVVITIAVIYPLSLLLGLAVARLFPTQPPIVRGLILTVAMVLSMTYAIMPMVTRTFSKWLYKN